ncbi:RusA family crossover junction endodeoxyribonuclease [Aggregatibacter actinomycetemcomitans]|uniref:RusA family crossover junction endodeoxyribonuclease n=1 Tax=Aggregatibacter actinomycetemcomitans TaxID=714 RepID=UPI0011D88BFD|nr:RusA family crossover junction endodeoxyribonuclease [Aggregatibacter actinomycetemcomitans]TYA25077.1 RusA family crossover junction endodeoxyribonuclease [Aggregatibacter actinomycetemcomitans]
MSDWLEICLPYPPSVNHYWRHTRSGRHYMSEAGRKFKAQAVEICKQFDPFFGAVAICLDVYYPDNRNRDPDNLFKVLCDSFVSSGLIEDDNNKIIPDLRIRSYGTKKGGMVVVKIRGLK